VEHRHLDPALLELVARGKLPDAALDALFAAQLRAGCRPCEGALAGHQAALREVVRRRPELRGRIWWAAHHGLLDAKRVLPASFREARRDLRRLKKLPPAERPEKVRRARTRFRTPEAIALFLQEARRALDHAPAEALAWLDLARDGALGVPAAVYSEEVAAALRLQVEAHRANALRAAGDLAAADARWSALRADPGLRRVADFRVHAELSSLEASLRLDQRRLGEADIGLADAARFYQAVGDDQRYARVLLKLGITAFHRPDPTKAARLCREAADLLATHGPRDLYAAAQLNLAVALTDLGRFAEAAALIADNRPLYEDPDSPETALRLAWIEGRLARGLDDEEAAERRLARAREGYAAAGNAFNAALVALDLAELYLAGGRTAEVKPLARATAEVFAERDVAPEVLRAAALFHEAAAAERLTLELLAHLRDAFDHRRVPTAGNTAGTG
jgi:hypothetical protein